MNIPFRVKKLTQTAKEPTRENAGDLWDLYADGFCVNHLKDDKTDRNLNKDNKLGCNYALHLKYLITDLKSEALLLPQGRILVKTGISLELPKDIYASCPEGGGIRGWFFNFEKEMAERRDYTEWRKTVQRYAVADIRPRSGLALKHGITVLNTPGTIDNSYRKEIGVILYNAGHEPYTITKGDKICQMLIRPLHPSKMEIVKEIEDTGRGGYGSTGK